MDVVTGLLRNEGAAPALERAAAVVRRDGGTLHLVRFVPDPSGVESEVMGFSRERERARDELEAAAVALRETAVATRTHLIVGGEGEASGALLRVANDVDADLVVISMRRRSRVGKLILGSNALDVLLGAPCPVLSVPLDDLTGRHSRS